jgi:hypothetical protein
MRDKESTVMCVYGAFGAFGAVEPKVRTEFILPRDNVPTPPPGGTGILPPAEAESKGTPHKCPICNGHGVVRKGFYTLEDFEGVEPCRSCVSGVIWG